MSLDMSHTIDAIEEGTKEVAETAHVKTSEFHENYVSKIVPDCGKYGDAAKFVAEMAPGVAEYNAIREGDWQSFAISAGIDVAALGVGVLTAGTGYGAVKGGSVAAKTGVKAATREIAEAGAKKAVKEVAEAGTKKAVKEVAEAGAEKAAKELAEEGVEKAAKETVETGAEKIAKETAEEGFEKTAKETAEKAAVRGAKEVGEEMDKKLVPQYLKEVEDITGRDIKPNQMEKFQKALKEDTFKKQTPEKSKLHRHIFDNAKDRLIDEWEKNTGEKWPVYVEDVYNSAGEVIRHAGQRFDAHHLIESCFGGPNAWWNLHPVSCLDHKRIHKGLAKIIF